MPYFSFSLRKKIINQSLFNLDESEEITNNKIYYSKNTKLWKMLNKAQNFNIVNFVKFEERIKLSSVSKKVLFCLPPNIGMGDAIEYGQAIDNIIKSRLFSDVGIAFIGKFYEIYSKYFNFKFIYKEIISIEEMQKFDSIFHLTLEIKNLHFQKYIRSNIESEILNFFKIKKPKYKYNINENKKKIKKINIFPISQSPLRSMSVNILNQLIYKFKNDYKIEILLDETSLISKYIEDKIIGDNFSIVKPNNSFKVANIVKNIEYGIFMDSGPLHLAKILNKKGIIIISTVNKKILLNDFNSISVFENNYKSKYCTAPCGLTNIFNYNNKSGCYDSLKIAFEDLMKLKNNNSLQRGQVKNSYIDFIKKPVACLNNINIDKLIHEIKKGMKIR